jgi:hypothetical protein
MVFIKEEPQEGKHEHGSYLKMSEERNGESCQVFVKEEMEEENVRKPAPGATLSEEDPLTK